MFHYFVENSFFSIVMKVVMKVAMKAVMKRGVSHLAHREVAFAFRQFAASATARRESGARMRRCVLRLLHVQAAVRERPASAGAQVMGHPSSGGAACGTTHGRPSV